MRLAFLFFCISFSTLTSAIGLATSGHPQENIAFHSYTSNNGLSHNGVLSIAQDSYGFMWFGTQNGLNRFDGYEFEGFFHDRDNTEFLQGSRVQSLLAMEDGRLLVGTSEGLSIYLPAKTSFVRILQPNGVELSEVRDLYRDNSGGIWVAAAQGVFALSKLSPFKLRLVLEFDSPALAGSGVDSIFEDSNETLWIGSSGMGLFFKLSGAEDILRLECPIVETFRIRSILEDPTTKELLVATHTNGIYRVKSPKNQSEPCARRVLNEVASGRKMIILNEKIVYLGSAKGLVRWNVSDDSYGLIRHDARRVDSIINGVAVSVFEGGNGVLWVATLSGISRWKNPEGSVHHVDPRTAFSLNFADSYISALVESPSGNLIASTFTQGLISWSPTTLETKYLGFLGERLSDSKVTALEFVNEELWIGTISGGINVVFGNELRSFVHDSQDETTLSSNSITSIFLDNNGEVWVTTYGGGLNKYLGDGRFHRFPGKKSRYGVRSEARSYAIGEDKWGRMWITEESTGLSVVNPQALELTGSNFRLDTMNQFLPNGAEDIAVSDQGLWVGLQNEGVAYVDFENEELNKHFEIGASAGIVLDDNGDAWFSGPKSVFVYRKESELLESFGRANGIRSQGFNSLAAVRMSNGLIAFGGENGFDVINPETLVKSNYEPPVVVTALEHNHREVAFDYQTLAEGLTMGEEITAITLSVAALDYSAPNLNRYKYQLEGFDKNWIDNGTSRTITYTNLDPGSYTLKVQGTNSDGVWSSNTLAIPINISPPWWATWWALTIYALLSLFMFYQLLIFARSRVDLEADKNFNRRMLRYVESLDDTGECVINANSKGNILFANSAVKTVLGKTMDQVMGRSFFQTLFPSPAEQDRVREILESDGRFLEEIAYELPGKKKARIVEVSITKADNPGVDDIAFVSVARDVTAHALANRELQKQHEELQLELKATVQELEDTQLESEQNQSNLEKHVELRDNLLRDVHDRVNDNFQMLASLLNIQSSKHPDESSRKLLDDSQQRLSAVALVHENLLHAKDLRTVDLGNYIDSLAVMLYRKHAPKDLQIQLTKEIEPIHLDIDQAVPVGLIVNELLTNALTHAYSSRSYGSGKVSITLYQSASDCVCIVADDGDGLPPGFNLEASESMGLETVAILVEQLGGSFSRAGGVGTTLEFRFPIRA